MQTTQKAQQEYDKMVKKASPNSPIFTNCLKAFVSGGLICAGGLRFHYADWDFGSADGSGAV